MNCHARVPGMSPGRSVSEKDLQLKCSESGRSDVDRETWKQILREIG